LAAEHTADRFLGRVGLAQRAADRAAVADDRIGDHLLGVAEQGEVRGQQLGREQLDVPGECADPDLVALLAYEVQLREVVDVDQVLGAGQPQLHHRQQAVPAGDDSRVGAEPPKGCNGALDAGRSLVLK